MLKTILGLNPLREKDLSESSLRRLRIYSVPAVLSIPVVTIIDFLGVIDPLSVAMKSVITLLAIGCILPFGFSRISSIFMRKKSDLDEWERTARVEAESFTLRLLLIATLIVFLAFNISTLNIDVAALLVPGETLIYILGNVLMFILMVPAAYMAWTQTPLPDDPNTRRALDSK